MKNFAYSILAVAAFLPGIAAAQSVQDQVIAQLQAQGYERIEIKNGPTQMKVEAIKGTDQFEAIYDLATGLVIKQEMNTVDAGDDTTPGIQIDQRDRDFIDASGNDDDDSIDDDGNDDHGGNHDANDDDDDKSGNSDDDNSDDNSDDDGDDDHGDDDHGNDDNGDDDSGDDD